MHEGINIHISERKCRLEILRLRFQCIYRSIAVLDRRISGLRTGPSVIVRFLDDRVRITFELEAVCLQRHEIVTDLKLHVDQLGCVRSELLLYFFLRLTGNADAVDRDTVIEIRIIDHFLHVLQLRRTHRRRHCRRLHRSRCRAGCFFIILRSVHIDDRSDGSGSDKSRNCADNDLFAGQNFLPALRLLIRFFLFHFRLYLSFELMHGRSPVPVLFPYKLYIKITIPPRRFQDEKVYAIMPTKHFKLSAAAFS